MRRNLIPDAFKLPPAIIPTQFSRGIIIIYIDPRIVSRPWISRYSTGSTSRVSAVEDRIPPITTVASGR